MSTIREIMDSKFIFNAQEVGVCAQGIHSGGPGSGCRGENCGRKGSGKGKSSEDKLKERSSKMADRDWLKEHARQIL